jgi:DNA invertase Pin-like site-specific DNA recombinase
VRLVEIRRVSSKDQAEDDRAGLARQAASIRATAATLGAELIDPPFVLVDVSRQNFVDTPEWQRIRRLISEPNVNIVVDDTDRFVAGWGGIHILQECSRAGTLIYHPGGVLDPSTLDGQILGVLRSLLAANELNSIRRRVQGAKEAKRRQGIFATSDIALATGIAYTRVKGQREGEWTYTADIERVKEVYRLVVHEGLRNWSEVGRHAGFSGATVRNILKNPIYKGLWIVDKKRVPGPTPIKADGRRKDRRKMRRSPEEVIQHWVYRSRGTPPEPGDARDEAAVDTATWDAAQLIQEEKTRDFYRPREPKGNTRFVYTSVLWCGECGMRMWSRTRPQSGRESGRRDWYACASTQRRGSCPTKYIDMRRLNSAVDRLFTVIFADERFLAGLVETGLSGEQEESAGKIETATAELRKLEGKRGKLLDLYLDDGFERAELDARRFKIDGELERARREMDRLRRAQEAADTSAVLEGLRDALVALHEFEFWTSRQKREFLVKFFPRVEVTKRGVRRVHFQIPSARTGEGREIITERALPLLLNVDMTWFQLQPPVELTEFGLPKKDLYTHRDLCVVLRLTDHQLRHRLATKMISEGKQQRWGKRAWTLEEMSAIWSAWNARELLYRWGLPKKAFYASADVCSIIGVTWEQLRYAIEKGRVVDCTERDSQGHRRWAAAEVERAVVQFGHAGGQVAGAEDTTTAGILQ